MPYVVSLGVFVQLVGCALLAVGIWAKVDEGSLTRLIKAEDVASKLSVLAWVIIVVGAVVFIVGFLGCCGAIRESQCLLATVIISQLISLLLAPRSLSVQ